jgi:uncharacterized protein (DUF1810 family)
MDIRQFESHENNNQTYPDAFADLRSLGQDIHFLSFLFPEINAINGIPLPIQTYKINMLLLKYVERFCVIRINIDAK